MKEYKIYVKSKKTGLTESFILSAPDVCVLCDLIKIISHYLDKDKDKEIFEIHLREN